MGPHTVEPSSPARVSSPHYTFLAPCRESVCSAALTGHSHQVSLLRKCPSSVPTRQHVSLFIFFLKLSYLNFFCLSDRNKLMPRCNFALLMPEDFSSRELYVFDLKKNMKTLSLPRLCFPDWPQGVYQCTCLFFSFVVKYLHMNFVHILYWTIYFYRTIYCV